MTSDKQEKHPKAIQKRGAAALKKKKDDWGHLHLVRKFLADRSRERRKLRQTIELVRRRPRERVGEEGARLILFDYHQILLDDIS